MRVFLHIDGTEGQSLYRAILPAKHLTEPLAEEGIELHAASKLTSSDYDVFIFHRLLSPLYMDHVLRLKRAGKTIIWELDDDVFHLPDWNPARRFYEQQDSSLYIMRDMADHIIVSTEPLAKLLGPKATVLPNLIDLELWPSPPHRHDGPVRVVWAGSIHHQKDLDLLVEPINDLLDEFGEQVYFLFFGDLPDAFSEALHVKYTHLVLTVPADRVRGKVGLVQLVPTSQYPKTLTAIQPDIGLAPLCDHPFNDSKSNIKWLEYSLAGAATVASPAPPYACIEYGIDGLLADNWLDEVAVLIEEPELRGLIAANARLRVEQEFSWQGKGKQVWLDFFRSLK